MSLYNDILSKKEKVAVIGLGYVGIPLAVAMAKKMTVIGFDINSEKINTYKNGIDPTGEVGNDEIKNTSLIFTDSEEMLKEAKFFIVAVPTPVKRDHTPNLNPVESASRIVGRNLTRGSVVVFESTVYPGVTEDVCVPILEAQSGLKFGSDFKVGYSPERINPGDKVHTLAKIVKVVSASDDDALEDVKQIYGSVISAGVYPVSSIKTAEAIKISENSQRDINIAFMNELAMIFDRLGIDTSEVVDGMNTKWNALGFRPGLVGGHCIGVDPYYFTYHAERLGYHSRIISAGRRVNDGMSRFIAEAAVKEMILAKISPSEAKVAILGVTFKENCPDTRNSRAADIAAVLGGYGITPLVCDPVADAEQTYKEYGIRLTDMKEIKNADCIIAAVAHDEYTALGADDIAALCAPDKRVMIDVKSIFDPKELKKHGFRVWRL